MHQVAIYQPQMKFPNLALAKIAGFHKSLGDNVEWYFPLKHYDILYISVVFSSTQKEVDTMVKNADTVYIGGSGIYMRATLPANIENFPNPNFSLFPENLQYKVGFTSRGCIRNCPFTSYELVSNGKVHTFTSNENYPIYIRNCLIDSEKTFYKLYQPYALPNKEGITYKFGYYPKGAKPADYVNGLRELKIAWENLCREKDDQKAKLPAVILCSGERDAANCYAYGYHPVWLNSETASLPKEVYFELKKYAQTIYNVPDIDETGKRKAHDVAAEFIDIRTVRLPEWLKNYKDMRGKPRKDLRDYFDLQSAPQKFEKLLANAMPYQFWQWKEKGKTPHYEIDTSFMLNMLNAHGFFVYKNEKQNTEKFVKIEGNIVSETTVQDMRRFCYNFIQLHTTGTEITNLFRHSTNVKNDIFSDLPLITIDFTNYTATSQYLFFNNCTVKVTKDGITEYKSAAAPVNAWKNKIIPFDYKTTDCVLKFDNNEFALTTNNIRSHYARYLINTSRVNWRKEMEERTTGNAAEDAAYFKANQFTLNGSRLTDAEFDEQMRNFMSKCFSIGYLLHKYKDPSNAWFLWCMENDVATKENKKGGGTGKSFTFEQALKPILRVLRKSGTKNLTENRFFLDRLDETTDIFLGDDCDKYFNIEFFKPFITGDTDTEGKTKQSVSIAFEDSPKFVFTSNFPLKDDVGFMSRRVQYVIYSDWYHNKPHGSDYREERKIRDDFGYNICTSGYKNEFWNEDLNFLCECLQFYLFCIEQNRKIEPPLAKVFERQNLAVMGEAFAEWADLFFADDTNLNMEVDSKSARFKAADYMGVNTQKYTSNSFTRSLKAYCESNDLEFNPTDYCTDKKKNRINRKNEVGENVAYFYIRKKNINN